MIASHLGARRQLYFPRDPLKHRHQFVFDDSTPSTQENYHPLLGQTRTHSDVFYVGAKKKESFLGYLAEAKLIHKVGNPP